MKPHLILLFQWQAHCATKQQKFHMSPFLLKHTENFMLENEDMRSVESLKNEQMLSPALAQKVPKKFIHEMESTPDEK